MCASKSMTYHNTKKQLHYFIENIVKVAFLEVQSQQKEFTAADLYFVK